MSFRLSASAFDAARPLLDRVQPRGWIWRGRQELDGLCCPKDWFDGEGRIAALTPWLDHAAAVRETDSLVVLDSEKPLACDCATLGRVLPLRRIEGALASFPFAHPVGSGAVLADHLLIIDQGERVLSPPGAFRPIDIARWWDFSAIDAEESTALPSRPLRGAEEVSSSITRFDPDAFEAGLEKVRDRIDRQRCSPMRFGGRLTLGVLGGLVRVIAWLMIIGVVISIATALNSDNGGLPWVRVLAFVITLYILSIRAKRLVGPPDGKAQGPGGGQGQGASPIAVAGLRLRLPQARGGLAVLEFGAGVRRAQQIRQAAARTGDAVRARQTGRGTAQGHRARRAAQEEGKAARLVRRLPLGRAGHAQEFEHPHAVWPCSKLRHSDRGWLRADQRAVPQTGRSPHRARRS